MEFESEDLAKADVEAMDNCLFGERRLVCQFMSPEKVDEDSQKEHFSFHQPSLPSMKYDHQWGFMQKSKMEYWFKLGKMTADKTKQEDD